jgi:Ca2+-transporting ATPase
MNSTPSLSRQLIPVMGLLLLLWLSFLVLREFLLTLAWAFIVAYVFFPIYQKCTYYLNGNTILSAAVVTGTMTATILILTYGLLNLLQDEMTRAYALLVTNFNQPTIELPKSIRSLPYAGEFLQNHLNDLMENRTKLNAQLVEWAKYALGETAHFLRSLGQHLVKLCFVLITVFFCFRNGEKWLQQLQLATSYFLNDTHGIYLQTAGDTSRAVVYGLFLAALGQGFVASIGYAFVGVSTPILLGALTTLLALIPMGATLVWLPTALMLWVDNQLWEGLGLLTWGFLVISTVDNVIRPLVICGASETPFLVVLFGVFGGLTAFGAIGLFLGPVILAVLLAVWRENMKVSV